MNKILLLSFIILLIYLGIEAVRHYRLVKKIPHRLAVTGIRGKSSITRLLAAGLKQAGYRVMAKTTGSRPVIIYPDGHEEEIRRRGKPSILEQKKLVRKAAEQKADYLVSEMMSIQPECLQAESRYFLQPELLVVSNIRPDHLEALGESEEDIARAFTSAFRMKTAVYIPEEEHFPVMQKRAGKKGTKVIQAKKEATAEQLANELPYPEFEANVRLAVNVLRACGLSDEVIVQGIKNVKPDSGCPRMWEKNFDDLDIKLYFVSLFAANDPRSSLEAMLKILERTGWWQRAVYGLLCFRSDRGDRTRQWVDFLAEKWQEGILTESGSGRQLEFSGLSLQGPGAAAAHRYLEKKLNKHFSKQMICTVNNSRPETVLRDILTRFSLSSSTKGLTAQHDLLVFGLGNIVGFGQKMIDYLERKANAIKL
ncbi:MAG TPA: poly-gamma-glutamate synthase PgsB [Candidatus Saccharicenans sp.]|jgi:poly-gamma-glutamate synthase PgsB/CapB|nr:poly-gamma-glutamate synthase PgsB [Candidatus Saccharicenans sp.]HRD01990.1 poly-gamma-glutamate synthase PgsB [Candidatus Saccharicenans sp.]